MTPSQTGNGGNYLTTNGSVVSWAAVPSPNSHNVNMTNNSYIAGGGGWGASGGTGSAGRAGGAGRKAIALNGNSVTFNATGTRYGATS